MKVRELTPLQSWSLTRKTIVVVGTLVLAFASHRALRWLRADITYWSRSVTFSYRSDSLEACTRLVALDLPGASVSAHGEELALQLPGVEGVIVKPAAGVRQGRIVVYGHSDSISTLGPASEESVQAQLRQLGAEFAKWCSGT